MRNITDLRFASDLVIIIKIYFYFSGVFGFLMMSILLVPFYYIKVGSPFAGNNSRGVIEDFPEAITQIMNNKMILFALIGKNSKLIINYCLKYEL